MSPEVIGRIVAAVIIAAISVLLYLFRDWFSRRRSKSPRTESAYNKAVWVFLVIAGLLVAAALLYAYITELTK